MINSNPSLEFYFDNRNGIHDVSPVSRLYRIGIVNTTKKSIDDVRVRIERIDALAIIRERLDEKYDPGIRGDLWGQSLMMMHDRSIPLKKTFTLHPGCEQALDFVQSVPSVKAEFKDGKQQLNIGRKIVVWHAARRYWRNGQGGILEDYAVDPLIDDDDYYSEGWNFYLEAMIGNAVETSMKVHVWFEGKVLNVEPEFREGIRSIPKRLQDYVKV